MNEYIMKITMEDEVDPENFAYTLFERLEASFDWVSVECLNSED